MTTKKNGTQIPHEKHETAAWASIEKQKPVSKVPLPAEFQVKNAKDYVDTNEK